MRANLSDDEMGEPCLVVVGNRIDLVLSSMGSVVSEEVVLDFIDELLLLSGSPTSGLAIPEDE